MPLNNITLQQLQLYEIAYNAPHNPAGADAWENWDISAIIPADALWVEVLCYNDGIGNGQGGVRADGSTVNRLVLAYDGQGWTCTVKNVGRVIEIFSAGLGTNFKFCITGYWK